MRYSFLFFSFLFVCCTLNNKENLLLNSSKNKDEIDFKFKKNKYPIWILGLHIWEDVENTSKAVNFITDEYQKNNIPFSSVIIDSPWAFSYNNFELDTLRYPEFQILINKLNEKRIKKIFWLTGFHNTTSLDAHIQRSNYYDFYKKNNYFTDNGRVFKWWKGSGSYVDFTNSNAINHFFKLMDKVDADGFKLDEGYSYLDDSVSTSAGIISKEKLGHLYYSSLTSLLLNSNKVTLGRAFSSQGRPYLHSFPDEVTFSWSGDHRGDFQGLCEQLDDVYQSIRFNHNLICWEVGGYNFPAPTKEDLLNSLKVGILLPSLNNGGRNGGLTNHLPWFHDKETISIFKRYVDIHYNLIPFFYNELLNKGKTSLLGLDSNFENSYFIGENLKVFTPTNSINEIECNFSNPSEWYNFFTNEKVSKHKLVFKNSFENIPLFIKRGTIMPYFNPFSKINRKITFIIFPFESNEYKYYITDVINNSLIDVVSIKYNVSKKQIEYNSKFIHEFEFIVMTRNRLHLIGRNVNSSIINLDNKSIINTTGNNANFNFLDLNNF